MTNFESMASLEKILYVIKRLQRVINDEKRDKFRDKCIFTIRILLTVYLLIITWSLITLGKKLKATFIICKVK